jgi:hypothetical protein
MSTEPTLAVIPSDRRRFYGAQAEAMQEKLDVFRAQHEDENAFPHAVVLNLNWSQLKVENGHIQYVVGACDHDKDFASYEIETPRTFTQYRASREGLNGIMERDYDLFALSPVEQALEFYEVYTTGRQTGRPLGGVVVFEGTKRQLLGDGKQKVRVPYITLSRNGKQRVVKFREVVLAKLIEDARAMQRVKTMEMIAEGQRFYDDNGPKNSNLTDEHRNYARLAYKMKWITKLPDFCSESTTAANLCNGCGNEYKSKTGKCQCGHVMYPLLAYEQSVIEYTHVRMDSLTPEEWKKAKALKDKRDKARAVN